MMLQIDDNHDRQILKSAPYERVIVTLTFGAVLPSLSLLLHIFANTFIRC